MDNVTVTSGAAGLHSIRRFVGFLATTNSIFGANNIVPKNYIGDDN